MRRSLVFRKYPEAVRCDSYVNFLKFSHSTISSTPPSPKSARWAQKTLEGSRGAANLTFHSLVAKLYSNGLS